MPHPQLTTPVAFMIFNRPDTTERVFNEIAKAKPTKLLVVGDGARIGRQGEAEKVGATRAIIERVDWDCEVLTNFADANLGCKRRMSSGIDWIFDQVERAIILEDDCMPNVTFFRFCEDLLETYRLDQRVAQISGVNLQFGHRINSDSYYFSRHFHIWGWATWRDRWKAHYDVKMKLWPRIRDGGSLTDLFDSPEEERYWTGVFERTFQGQIDTWDYQWFFACMLQGRLAILPNANLISNIGFGPAATHTTGSGELANMSVQDMEFPLRHPLGVFQCRTLDSRYFKRFLGVPLYRRIKHRLRHLAST
jgi:hypothetical protein